MKVITFNNKTLEIKLHRIRVNDIPYEEERDIYKEYTHLISLTGRYNGKLYSTYNNGIHPEHFKHIYKDSLQYLLDFINNDN